MEYVIETQNLCKSYRGKAAVSSLNMHVQKGDIYGFIGRNGAGKSTTLKCSATWPILRKEAFLFLENLRIRLPSAGVWGF